MMSPENKIDWLQFIDEVTVDWIEDTELRGRESGAKKTLNVYNTIKTNFQQVK